MIVLVPDLGHAAEVLLRLFAAFQSGTELAKLSIEIGKMDQDHCIALSIATTVEILGIPGQ